MLQRFLGNWARTRFVRSIKRLQDCLDHPDANQAEACCARRKRELKKRIECLSLLYKTDMNNCFAQVNKITTNYPGLDANARAKVVGVQLRAIRSCVDLRILDAKMATLRGEVMTWLNSAIQRLRKRP